MLGSKCCCGKKLCGSQARTGGSGVDTANYDFPAVSGRVNLSIKTTGNVEVEVSAYDKGFNNYETLYTVIYQKDFNTNGEWANLSFRKRDSFNNTVTVKITGKEDRSDNYWEYLIGCPENECLIITCPETKDLNPAPSIESITLTLDVPSYKLTIPRIGAEYWYHYWEPLGPQVLLDDPLIINPRNPNGEIVNKEPVILPLDFKCPQLRQETYPIRDFANGVDFIGETRHWTIGDTYKDRLTSSSEFGTDVVPESEYVRPDELPQGWYPTVTEYYPAPWNNNEGYTTKTTGISCGRWEFVGKLEFEASYELDGDAYSGTYELQKVVKEDGTVGWIYYFDDGEPYCNGDEIPNENSDNVFIGLFCRGRYLRGTRYPKSFIYVEGCNVYISNIKAKINYSRIGSEGEVSCQPKYSVLDGFSGYGVIHLEYTAMFTNGTYNVFNQLDGSSKCCPGITWDWRGYCNNYGYSQNEWAAKFIKDPDGNPVNAAYSSLVDREYNEKTGQTEAVGCFGDRSELYAIKETCTYSNDFVDDECNPTCPAVIPVYNGIGCGIYSKADDILKLVTIAATPKTGNMFEIAGDNRGNIRNIRAGGTDGELGTTTVMSSFEQDLRNALGKGAWWLIDPEFFSNSYYYNTTLPPGAPQEPYPYAWYLNSYPELGLPWIGRWMRAFVYARNPDNPTDFTKRISPYDPYAEETGHVWRLRCKTQDIYLEPPALGPNEWLCGKCATQWYVDNGYWIEEAPSRRNAEIFVTDITPTYEGQNIE